LGVLATAALAVCHLASFSPGAFGLSGAFGRRNAARIASRFML
jgi:hypothetical protein